VDIQAGTGSLREPITAIRTGKGTLRVKNIDLKWLRELNAFIGPVEFPTDAPLF
jgi:hypothetical protein